MQPVLLIFCPHLHFISTLEITHHALHTAWMWLHDIVFFPLLTVSVCVLCVQCCDAVSTGKPYLDHCIMLQCCAHSLIVHFKY